MSHANHNAHVVAQFSQQAHAYTQLTTSLASDRSRSLQALVEAAPGDLALEVCCGPGALALDLAPAVAHVTGMDLTPAMLEQARDRQAQRGIANIDWRIGDIHAIPFEDEHFAIVMCSAAFHHLEQPARAFAELVRVCRPGGRILVKDVTPEADKAARYDLIEKMRDPSHVHALTLDELRTLGAGLPVDEVSVRTSVTRNVSFDAVLATSFPETCTAQDIHLLVRADALSGEDRLGLAATLVDGELRVSYRMTSALWKKRGDAQASRAR